MALTAQEKYLLNNMNSTTSKVQLGTLIDETVYCQNASLDGTTLYGILLDPQASVATAGVNYHRLFSLEGDFGDVGKPTTGILATFSRTAIASGVLTDTALDVRITNSVINASANTLQGAYIKCKNSSGKTSGNVIGLFVEAICDGTVTNGGVGIKIGSDGKTLVNAIDMSSAVTTNGADIKLSSGLTIGSGSAAPTHAAATGSLYIRTGQSDQKAMLYVCTVNSGTWVLLNTVTA